MGSGVDAIIAQGVKPVNIDPTLGLQRRLAIGDVQAQQQQRIAQAQMQQAQAADLQTRNQQAQLTLKDEQGMQQALLETKGWDPDALVNLAATKYGVSPAAIQKFQAADIENVKNKALVDKDTLANEQVRHDALSGKLEAIKALPPEERQAAFDEFWEGAKDNLSAKEFASDYKLFGTSTDDVHLNAFQAALNLASVTAKRAIEKQTADASTKNANTQAAKQTQELAVQHRQQGLQALSAVQDPGAYAQWLNNYPEFKAEAPPQYSPGALSVFARTAVPVKDQPEYDVKAAQSRALQTNKPEDWDASVDATIPPQKYPQANAAMKAQVRQLVRMGEWNKALELTSGAAKTVLEQEATTNRETDPRVLAARVNQAVGTQVAVAKASPGMFDDIPDPQSRHQAQGQFEKYTNEYADKAGTAAQLHDFVAAAQSGNKAAPALIGPAELRQVVNRVNRQELEQVTAGSGDAIDRVQGFIDKYTKGEPIPPEVLTDMNKLSQVTQAAARRTYSAKVAGLRATQGGQKARPLSDDELGFTGASAASSGKRYTQADVDAAVKAHPGLTALQADQAFKGKGWVKQ